MLQTLGHASGNDAKHACVSKELASVTELSGKAETVIAWLSEDGLVLVFDWLTELKEDCKRLALDVAGSDDCSATSLAWIPDLGVEGNPLLCVGFAHGGVSLFSHKAVVLFSFLVSPTAILRVRYCISRQPTEDAMQMPGASLMLLHEHGRVVVIEAEGIRKVATEQLPDPEDHPLEALRFSVYDLRGRAGITDAVLLPDARLLEDPFAIKRCEDTMSVVALGSQPFLSMHSLRHTASSSGGPGRSLLGTASVFLGLGSYARSWVTSRNTSSGHPQRDRGAILKIAGFAQASEIQAAPRLSTELPVAAKFIDASRQGEVLIPAPWNSSDSTRLAATCDAYGRVSLFCLESLRCLHLWKGYRDAQVAWVSASREKAVAGEGHEHHNKDHTRPDLPGLVIYAPRRGLLELWHLWSPAGPKRLAASCVGSDCVLLSQGGRAYLWWQSGKMDRVLWPAAGAATPPSIDPDSDAFDSADSQDTC